MIEKFLIIFLFMLSMMIFDHPHFFLKDVLYLHDVCVRELLSLEVVHLET